MEHYWEIERLRALQEDTPHIWEQQSGFLRPVVQPNNYHWMPEPSITTFAQQNEMGKCVICDGNHLSDQCIYLSEWQNYQKPTYFTEPSYFPSYPPSTYYPQQKPEPSEEEQLIDMLKKISKKRDEKLDAILETSLKQLESIQRQSEFIQRMTDQMRQFTENQDYIPQEPVSDDIDEAFKYQSFHNDTSTEEEAEQYQQPEVSVQEPEPVKSQFDFYYSDSDEDEADLFVPTAPTTEDQTFNPQNEDLGACFTMMFEEDLSEPSIPVISEDEDLMSETSLHPQVDNFEACISQMTDEELNTKILQYICEEKVEQEVEQMEEQMSDLNKDPEHSGETSLFWGVQIKDITQKLDRMELPFQVKHHIRPPDFPSFFAGTTGTTTSKKVARALNGTKLFLPPYRWKRPFKSNAHGIVFYRTSKTTLKPP